MKPFLFTCSYLDFAIFFEPGEIPFSRYIYSGLRISNAPAIGNGEVGLFSFIIIGRSFIRVTSGTII